MFVKPIRSIAGKFASTHTFFIRVTLACPSLILPKHESASDFEPCDAGPWFRVLSMVELWRERERETEREREREREREGERGREGER